MIAEVDQARERSGMSVRDSLKILGVAFSSYYRWKREAAWNHEQRKPIKPVQVFEALPEEKQAVRSYALQHPEIRHRELAWRMIDENVAYLSPSTVYRILLEENLMNRHRGRKKRYREELEKATRPDEIWGTDLMYLRIGEVQYFLVAFIDEYSRYLVHWELVSTMDGMTLSTAAQAALQQLPMNEEGRVTVQPIIRSDNGSGYISQEFGSLLEHHRLVHHRIKPHCPEENGVMERANRTLREKLDELELTGRSEAEDALKAIVLNYNNERLHSALGFKPPATYYRGNPAEVDANRLLKLRQARHQRKEMNLKLKQKTLPLSAGDIVG
jgi:transposase InsO family protein